MKPTFFLTAILFFAALVILSSCNSDETVTGGNSSTVTGTVLDVSGFPVSPARVWLNHDSYADVNADGTFLFNNVKKPYNLTVNRGGATEFTVYEGLTSSSPKMYLSAGGPNLPNQANMIVTFPKPPNFGKSSFAFLCNEPVISGQYFGSDTVVNYILHWWSNTRLKGKFTIIQFERDINGLPTVFNRFGFKDTAISAGDTIYLNFSSSDMQYDPSESSVNIIFPQGANNGVGLYIMFSGYKNTSSIYLGGTQGSNIPSSYAVPGTLPLGYSIGAFVGYPGGYSQLFLAPGSTFQIPPVVPVNLISPADGDSADYNTDFVHDGTSDVYMTVFSAVTTGGYFAFYVCSASKTIKMPLLPFFGINVPVGTEIGWGVNGYNGFNGINDFASESRLNNVPYSVVYSASERHIYLK